MTRYKPILWLFVYDRIGVNKFFSCIGLNPTGIKMDFPFSRKSLI